MAEPAALRRTPVVPAAEGLRLLEPAARFILRAEARAIRSAGAALGIDVLSTPCRASRGQTRSMLWLGPDEYLLLAPQVEAPTVAGAVEGALQAEPHALVDVSHRQTKRSSRAGYPKRRMSARSRRRRISRRYVYPHRVRQGRDRSVAHRARRVPSRSMALLH